MKPTDENYFDKGTDNHGNAYRNGNCQRQRKEMMKRDSYHPSEHDKFSLGKVNDAGCVINYVKSNRNYGINATIGDTSKKIL